VEERAHVFDYRRVEVEPRANHVDVVVIEQTALAHDHEHLAQRVEKRDRVLGAEVHGAALRRMSAKLSAAPGTVAPCEPAPTSVVTLRGPR
jgi:hypothetical protein